MGPVVAFPVGSTVVRRDVLRGQVWSALPNRVLADDGERLVLGCWPGVRMLAPTTWTAWLETGEESVRREALPNLAVGRWDLGAWAWRDTVLVTQLRAGDWFAVHRYLDGSAAGWYVNFELPYRRITGGVETFDLLLDLVVTPDLSSASWKDEDEYAQARRLGLIGDEWHHAVEEARGEVMALVAERRGPFAEDWSRWRPDPGWPLPELPEDRPGT
jgi:hypothetical protein